MLFKYAGVYLGTLCTFNGRVHLIFVIILVSHYVNCNNLCDFLFGALIYNNSLNLNAQKVYICRHIFVIKIAIILELGFEIKKFFRPLLFTYIKIIWWNLSFSPSFQRNRIWSVVPFCANFAWYVLCIKRLLLIRTSQSDVKSKNHNYCHAWKREKQTNIWERKKELRYNASSQPSFIINMASNSV